MDGSNTMEEVFAWKNHSLAKNIIHFSRKGIKHPYRANFEIYEANPFIDGPNTMEEVFARKSHPLSKNIICFRRKGMKHPYRVNLETYKENFFYGWNKHHGESLYTEEPLAAKK